MKNLAAKFIVLLLIGVVPARVLAQGKTPNTVAIYLYEGVELLDFAGPGEVFTASGFDVYTVSIDGKPLVSQGFVRIVPKYALANAPTPDIVVFPGGHSSPTANDTRVQQWVKDNYQHGTFFLSVCTGAEVLAKADLLKGLQVTTFHNFIPGLQKMLPDSKVLENTRFVDNGTLLTTAGVSAGIDGALHLVSRIKGLDVAQGTAHYMEYEKWNPSDGLIARTNPVIGQLRASAALPEQSRTVPVIDLANTKDLPYEGELKNVAAEFHDAKQYQHEAYALEIATKLYPNGTAYNSLAKVYKQLGKPAPIDEESLLALVDDGRTSEALARVEKDLHAFPTWTGLYNEQKMNRLGYRLISKNKVNDAIAVFQFNARRYPKSSNAFDSLGEAYFIGEQYADATANYKKSLDLDPGNDNAKKMLSEIAAKTHK